ncbi:uncharacterized protein ARB_05479 [Trichophyton benhamiae CBS 112371]|uniref:Uncharacterized protein n=1 Tax=Arthroderma benhamiae (strain ATCC MYA-4681 / CBS 112371) TaxID=663331 RepID=D4AMM6_ARTBC|nr:uncharacterized protein ARB_05479 [Trichophyton benhamiae CBS 112371]EFE35437.1 hypothetical protein ARB_05479 [Trichophyton benhamiae CBS 112371]
MQKRELPITVRQLPPPAYQPVALFAFLAESTVHENFVCTLSREMFNKEMEEEQSRGFIVTMQEGKGEVEKDMPWNHESK